MEWRFNRRSEKVGDGIVFASRFNSVFIVILLIMGDKIYGSTRYFAEHINNGLVFSELIHLSLTNYKVRG